VNTVSSSRLDRPDRNPSLRGRKDPDLWVAFFRDPVFNVRARMSDIRPGGLSP
jgi:hypothetical protein